MEIENFCRSYFSISISSVIQCVHRRPGLPSPYADQQHHNVNVNEVHYFCGANDMKISTLGDDRDYETYNVVKK